MQFHLLLVLLMQLEVTQAPPRAGIESTRASSSERYKGHVLQILIEIRPTESIGNMVHKAPYVLFTTIHSSRTRHPTLHVGGISEQFSMDTGPTTLPRSPTECTDWKTNLSVPR